MSEDRDERVAAYEVESGYPHLQGPRRRRPLHWLRRLLARSPRGVLPPGAEWNLREAVTQALANAPLLDADDIQVQVVEDAEVLLEGTVLSMRDKAEAERRVVGVDGVRAVHNKLRVRAPV